MFSIKSHTHSNFGEIVVAASLCDVVCTLVELFAVVIVQMMSRGAIGGIVLETHFRSR
jgi:hypothetical protein